MESQVWVDEWERVRPFVRSQMSRYGLPDYVDDVMQELWLSMAKTRANGGYDAERGPLGALVMTMAKRRCIDQLNSVVKSRQANGQAISNLDETPLLEAVDDSLDPSAQVVMHAELMEFVRKFLFPVFEALPLRMEVLRSVLVMHVSFDSNIQEAAKHFGCSTNVMRANFRQVATVARTIRKVQHIIEGGSTPSLLDCLPDGDEMGGYLRAYGSYAQRMGGFSHVVVQDSVQVLNTSYNTARQYFGDVKQVLEVANWMFENLGVTPVDQSILARKVTAPPALKVRRKWLSFGWLQPALIAA